MVDCNILFLRTYVYRSLFATFTRHVRQLICVIDLYFKDKQQGHTIERRHETEKQLKFEVTAT